MTRMQLKLLTWIIIVMGAVLALASGSFLACVVSGAIAGHLAARLLS